MTFNETTSVTSDLRFIHQLVEKAVREQSNHTAVVFKSSSITYKQLNQRADSLCQVILRTAADAPIIAVSTTRCIEMVISVLAVLKAGKAYLPIDPDYPELRLQQILTEAELTVCLTTEQDADTFRALGLNVILAENEYEFPESLPATQQEQACVLYTSGSTGKPKGVCLNHAGLVNLLRWQLAHSVARPGLNSLQFSHLNFDASFPEIFVPLVSGGTIYLIDEASRLDAARLLDFLEEHTINRIFLPYVALQYLAEAADAEKRYPDQLFEVTTGGEQIKITPQIARFFAALPDCTFMNAYGPTEASVWITEKKLKGDALNWPHLPPVGKAIGNTEVFILNEELQLVADEQVGELCIGGVCLATGYLNQPALTAEKFIDWKHPQRGNVRVYRTGDLARRLPDGDLEFCGRRDDQIKIRGNRVELGEIEVVLMQQPIIQQAVVVAREDTPGQKMLAAYLVAKKGKIDTAALRKAIAQQLPDYMIPAYFTVLDDLPKSISGKVDRKALPKPNFTRPELATLYRKPSTATEQAVARIWCELLYIDRIGLDDNFFELGGNSLLAQKTVAALKNQLGFVLPITKLYQYPSIAGITAYLNPDSKKTTVQPVPTEQKSNGSEVAVIGMAGRFPGATSVEALWELLREGRETIRFFSDSEIDPSVPDWEKNDPQYVKARGILDQADQFDPAFFGINPKLAELMDPQQRIFLEIAWEALEQAGYLPARFSGSIGVYAGCGTNTYYLNNVRNYPERINQVGGIQVSTANEKDYIASRVAYHLDLKGPSVSVYAASATSLLAIAQAVAGIRNGECKLALAGGVSVTAPQLSGHVYQEGAMFSPDGHCRPFDARAQGTVFSDGAGVVLLKNLEAAQRDGDTIYAVVKGIGVTNDGEEKAALRLPVPKGRPGLFGGRWTMRRLIRQPWAI
ncbi:non-ribosomal peptide synthetase [Spirosoma taeanense]|uniref:non-ribosomal peptide synthetase n=1 Tax=Spirosoma taeanense TaxID=2735870 RepID=UPI00293BBEAA|nr:amino acid adenylation domain-containing protein [Spirosoma taeanense]